MTKTTATCLQTRNEAWGFYGTIGSYAPLDDAWNSAMRQIGETTGASEEGCRDFLDSRDGRHFADKVSDELTRGRPLDEAIRLAVVLYMSWSIGRKLSRETGIPARLPYLMGMVHHYEILASA